MGKTMPDTLKAVMPPDCELPPATCDAEKIRNYLSDESSAMTGAAEKVFFAETAGHVSAVLRAARRAGRKVTVSAAGTSITGARVPLSGGWIVSVERMRHVAPDNVPPGFDRVTHGDMSFYLNPGTRQAVAPPGVTLAEFNAALTRYGLTYPPDPTEMSAMLGGTVATNASGARSFFYGPTREWIRGLEVVLPTGAIVRFRRGESFARGGIAVELDGETRRAAIGREYPVFKTKNAAGLYLAEGMDMIDLFIGHEGLLGVVTSLLVNLIETPVDVATCVAFFGAMADALGFVDALRERNAATEPLSIEYFDRRALGFIRDKFPDIPENSAGAVLFEFRHRRPAGANPYPSGAALAPWLALLTAHNAVANWSVVGRDVARIKEFRHALPEAVNAFVRARVGKLGTDMAVPPGNFRKMVAAYEAADACGVRTVFFGHVGDCHLHLNFLPENADELKIARKKYLELARLAVELGGTISAEHGVGKKTVVDENGERIPYLEIMLGRDGLKNIYEIKKLFDPDFILNPGNMVPEGYRQWT